ncbi:MAG: hypothetical protein K0S36_879 [Nitrosospira multiformis]|nr:hypothetical protein [Nitrosospira multiformis]
MQTTHCEPIDALLVSEVGYRDIFACGDLVDPLEEWSPGLTQERDDSSAALARPAASYMTGCAVSCSHSEPKRGHMSPSVFNCEPLHRGKAVNPRVPTTDPRAPC